MHLPSEVRPAPGGSETHGRRSTQAAASASWPSSVGGWLGAFCAFLLWRLVLGGGCLGLLIAVVLAPLLSLPFIALLSLFAGDSKGSSRLPDNEAKE